MSVSKIESLYLFIIALLIFLWGEDSKVILLGLGWGACIAFFPSYQIIRGAAGVMKKRQVTIVCLAAVALLMIPVFLLDSSKPTEASLLFIAAYFAFKPYRLLIIIFTRKS